MAGVRVARAGQIPEGEGKVIALAGREIAVFHVEGEFHALDNICPHREGPLGDGVVVGHHVVCPWHGWQFDCRTGKSPVNAEVSVARYPTHLEGDDVFVDFEAAG